MALRVLLADESTTIKKVMQLALQDFAVEVKAVHVGVDVVAVARGFKPDIVFADVLLQKKNGYEVCTDLKADPELKSLPVVLMWSSFMELDERLAKDCRAEGRLEKPFEVENLRQLVMQLVPRTNSQRLAHFIQYASSVAEPLRKEESAKRDSQPAPAAAVSAPQAKPQAPSPTAQVPARPTAPSQPAQPSAPPQAAKPTPTPAAPPTTQAPKPAVPPTPASTAAPATPAKPSAAISSAISDAAKASSAWTMDSFDDIEDFAALSEQTEDTSSRNLGSEFAGTTPSMDESTRAGSKTAVPLSTDPDDLGDEEGFSEFKLTNLSANTSPAISGTATGVKPGTSSGVAPSATPSATPGRTDDRDPWSHQDLSRFKLDLEPVSVDNDELGLNFDVSDPHVSGTDFLLKKPKGPPPPHPTKQSPVAPSQPSAPPETLEPSFELESNPDHGAYAGNVELSADELPMPGSLGHLDVNLESPSASGPSFELNQFELPADAPSLEMEMEPEDQASSPQTRSTRIDTSLSAPIPQLSEDRLEQIIRAQSREIIEAVVRRVVPDLATEIIRKELQRLLEEPSVSRPGSKENRR